MCFVDEFVGLWVGHLTSRSMMLFFYFYGLCKAFMLADEGEVLFLVDYNNIKI
jgi:hypothetical protein